MKLYMKYTVESSITSKKELFPHTFVETLLHYLQLKKIIACFGARYAGLAQPPKQIFQRKTFCLALLVFQVSADVYFSTCCVLQLFPVKTTFVNF